MSVVFLLVELLLQVFTIGFQLLIFSHQLLQFGLILAGVGFKLLYESLLVVDLLIQGLQVAWRHELRVVLLNFMLLGRRKVWSWPWWSDDWVSLNLLIVLLQEEGVVHSRLPLMSRLIKLLLQPQFIAFQFSYQIKEFIVLINLLFQLNLYILQFQRIVLHEVVQLLLLLKTWWCLSLLRFGYLLYRTFTFQWFPRYFLVYDLCSASSSG